MASNGFVRDVARTAATTPDVKLIEADRLDRSEVEVVLEGGGEEEEVMLGSREGDGSREEDEDEGGAPAHRLSCFLLPS